MAIPERQDRQKSLDVAINRNGDEMRRILLSARDRVQLQIINAVKKGNPAGAAWIRDNLYRNLQKEYSKLQGDLNGWTRSSVTSVAQEWTKYAVEDIPGGNYDKAWTQFSKKHLDEIVAQFSPSTMAGRAAVNAGLLDPAVGGMLKQDIDSLRRIVQDTTREQAATGMTASEWRRIVQDRVLQENAAWKFIDSSGKTWSANNYFNMLNRTVAAETARETYLTQMAESEHDLATIEGGIPPNCCPDCLRWAGKIVSVSGTSKDYPSYKQAKEDGVFHPRCRHYLAVVLEGEEEEAKAEEERVRKWAADNGFPLTQKKVAPGDVKQTDKAKEKPLIEQQPPPSNPRPSDKTPAEKKIATLKGSAKTEALRAELEKMKAANLQARLDLEAAQARLEATKEQASQYQAQLDKLTGGKQ